MKTYSVEEINKRISGTLVGNQSLMITKVEQVDCAESNQITFIGHKKYIKLWKKSKASAAIVYDNFKLDLDADLGTRRLDRNAESLIRQASQLSYND